MTPSRLGNVSDFLQLSPCMSTHRNPLYCVLLRFVFGYPASTVNAVIADKNVVTQIMNNSTGLQRIELNGFAKCHWKTGYYPFAYGWCLGLC